MMRRISRDTLSNVAGSILPLAVSLVTIPMFIHRIGEARYGVLAIVWLLLGYFGLFELGLSRATANQIARLHDAPPVERQSVFWTALLLNGVLGTVGGVLLWALGDALIGNYFRIPENLRQEISLAVPWIAMAVPVSILGAVLSGTLEARGRFLQLNAVQITSAILFQVLPLSCAYLVSSSLSLLVPVSVLSRFICLLPLFALALRAIPMTGRSGPQRRWVRPLLSYGGWITLTNSAGQVIQLFDQFLIGVVLGAKEVARYNIPFSIAWRLTMFPAALVRTLFPEFAKMDGSAAWELCSRSLRAAGAAFVIPVLIAVISVEPFLSIWIGPDFADESGPVGSILLLGIWLNAIAYIPLALLQARGRPDVGAKVFLLEAIPFVAVLWVALNEFGLQGAAWAWTGRVVIETTVFVRIVGIATSALTLWPGAVILLLGWLLAKLGDPADIGYWPSGLLLIGCSVAWAIRVEPRLAELVRNTLQRKRSFNL